MTAVSKLESIDESLNQTEHSENGLCEELNELTDFKLDDLFSDENSTDVQVDENRINQERIEYLELFVTPQLLSLIKNEEFEFDIVSESSRLVEEQLRINEVATQFWFNKMYVRYYSGDEKYLIGLLRVIEGLPANALTPVSTTMALAALSHENIEVNELGVRIFEKQASIEAYEVLKKVKTETRWLQSYINQVIHDLQHILCLT